MKKIMTTKCIIAMMKKDKKHFSKKIIWTPNKLNSSNSKTLTQIEATCKFRPSISTQPPVLKFLLTMSMRKDTLTTTF